MKNHGVEGHEFFALQAIDEKARSSGEVRLAKLGLDVAKALHRASIIVVVMADEQLFRETRYSLRIERKRLGYEDCGRCCWRLRCCASGDGGARRERGAASHEAASVEH